MVEFSATRYSLIARIQDAGDEASWFEFQRLYRPVVLRMCRKRGLQDADAEDVTQQVFMSISRSIEEWTAGPDQPPFRAWLTTIARNAMTKMMSRRPRDAATGSTTMLEVLHALPDAEATRVEIDVEARGEIVQWAADQIRNEFGDDIWQAFWQTTIEAKSIADVSLATGRSTGSIYVARHRIIARMKEKVRELLQRWELPERHQ